MEATDHRLSLAIQLATLELKLHDFIQALDLRYSPDQPRVPAGNPDSGQRPVEEDRAYRDRTAAGRFASRLAQSS